MQSIFPNKYFIHPYMVPNVCVCVRACLVISIFVITIILIQIMNSYMYFEENRSKPLAVGNPR